jgi:cytochrome c peroxidase
LVVRDIDEQGRDLGTMSYMLRVFLIDRERQIRNIHSPSLLHADAVLVDLHTLQMQGPAGNSLRTDAPGVRATSTCSNSATQRPEFARVVSRLP